MLLFLQGLLQKDKYGDVSIGSVDTITDRTPVELFVPGLCVVFAYLALMYLGHSLDHQKRVAKRRLQPPVRAEFALYLLLNGSERDAAVGDLIERYPQVVERYGKRRADVWAWSQVLRSIGPILRRLVTLGGLLTAAALIKRVFGNK